MKQNQYLFLLFALIVLTGCGGTQKKLTEYVNPFLGTATLWEPEDLGYTRKIKSRTAVLIMMSVIGRLRRLTIIRSRVIKMAMVKSTFTLRPTIK